MRAAVGLVLSALITCASAARVEATSPEWEPVPLGPAEPTVAAVAVTPAAPARVFAATTRALYVSSDGGTRWQERLRVPVHTRITTLAASSADPPGLLLGTSHGLYGSSDGGEHWERLWRDAGEEERWCTHVAFHPSRPGTALLGTRTGAWLTRDGGRRWEPVTALPAATAVVHLTFAGDDSDQLYAVTSNGLWIGHLTQGTWQQRIGIPNVSEEKTASAEESSLSAESTDPERPLRALRAVAVDPQTPSTLYLASSHGLDVSRDGGLTWTAASRAGLIETTLSRLLPIARSPLVLYAATPRGVVRYDPAQERWEALTQGLTAAAVNDLAATSSHLFAATDRGLYRYELAPDELADIKPPSIQELLANFSYEPSMAQVRETAIRYAEVHPEKIARWRRQAALRALLPSVDVGMDLDRSRDIRIDEGSFPNFQLIKTQDRDAGMDVSVTWELGDLVWNEDQTNIDVRSKLMVQLRDDIVNEVTRTYFERRRLQVALLTNPPTDQQALMEKELRLQELTALLDGLTGGYFSKQITPEHH